MTTSKNSDNKDGKQKQRFKIFFFWGGWGDKKEMECFFFFGVFLFFFMGLDWRNKIKEKEVKGRKERRVGMQREMVEQWTKRKGVERRVA